MKIIHTVRNETLDNISMRYGIRKSEILKRNNIEKSDIIEGKILILDIIEGTTYIVRPKDTLSTIAMKNKVTIEDIQKLNNLTEIFVGEVIKLPVR